MCAQILAFVLSLPHDQSFYAFGDRAFQCLKAFADVFRRLIRLPRQCLDFGSNDCKTTARLTCPCRFNRGVQRKHIRLPRYFADTLNDRVEPLS